MFIHMSLDQGKEKFRACFRSDAFLGFEEATEQLSKYEGVL